MAQSQLVVVNRNFQVLLPSNGQPSPLTPIQLATFPNGTRLKGMYGNINLTFLSFRFMKNTVVTPPTPVVQEEAEEEMPVDQPNLGQEAQTEMPVDQANLEQATRPTARLVPQPSNVGERGAYLVKGTAILYSDEGITPQNYPHYYDIKRWKRWGTYSISLPALPSQTLILSYPVNYTIRSKRNFKIRADRIKHRGGRRGRNKQGKRKNTSAFQFFVRGCSVYAAFQFINCVNSPDFDEVIELTVSASIDLKIATARV